MLRIAVSGHRGLPAQTVTLVDRAIRAHLAECDSAIVGLTCLADGADQIFARAVLDAGGSIEVVVPAERYRDGLPAEVHGDYDELLSKAAHVHRLTYDESSSEAHMSASIYMLEHAEELWAVWDGLPARGYGGTADVVAHARSRGWPVTVIWPDGAARG